MNIITIIPARYASTRFPGKPLIDIEGKSMIQRVYEQAKQARQISEVVVATDDQRIVDHLTSLNIPYVMTDASHQSGTDRCAEAAMHIKADAVINLQGDEPFIDPGQIDAIAQLLNDGARIATLVKPISISEELFNPNKPKVVLNSGGQALYFSRSAI
ncbi:MAG: 3-deoxy-manno-octulosonate cytidylyltransferase, partial [Bacteroidota bacterium]